MRAHLGGVVRIDSHCVCQSKALHEQPGLTVAPSAHAVSLDARTVASWRCQERLRPRKARPRASKLAPFTAQMVQRLDTYPSSAAQVFQRVRAHGFEGGSALVTASGRTVRPTRQPALLPLALAPGACAQVDGGSCGSVSGGHTRRRLRVFGMVLCYSRLRSVECPVSQTREHFWACHQQALECFGGRPRKGMVDHRQSAGLTRALGAAPGCNPQDADVAAPHGCTLVPCHVGTGHAKGRVDNGVGYVTKHCLAGLEIPDLRVLHPAARPWLDTSAHVRLHGATRPQPPDLWHQERPPLRPLPPHPFDSATVSQSRASRQFRVPLETQRSSVPAHWAGHALTLKTSPDRLCLSHGETLIARQSRRDDRFQDFAAPDPPTPRLAQRQKARDHQVFRRLLALSSPAEADDRTREERRLNPHHHGRKSVALRDISTPQAVGRALEDALVSAAFSSDSLANLVGQRARFTPEARPLHLPRRHDLLDVRLAPPDLSLSQATTQPESPPREETA